MNGKDEMNKAEWIGKLIHKSLKGELTNAENEALNNFINESDGNRKLYDKLSDPKQLVKGLQKMYSYNNQMAIQKEEESPVIEVPTRHAVGSKRLVIRWVAAASVLIALTITLYTKIGNSGSSSSAGTKESLIADIPPASNKATLTLSTGKTIDLEVVKAATIASDGNTQIQMNDSGQITYVGTDNKDHYDMVYNTIAVPRGGIYSVVLDDGTKIWLNNETVIRYPVAFAGPERRIALSGEAFFEVTKDATKPFIVELPNSKEIRVLGTSFNAKAFVDEKLVTTTLIEGSIKLTNKIPGSPNYTSSVILKPGEQAKIFFDKQSIANEKLQEEDILAALAWRKGLFHFDNENIEGVMTQIARWYDLDVQYSESLPNETIDGDLYRNSPLSNVLDKLEKIAKVKFERKGKLITVSVR